MKHQKTLLALALLASAATTGTVQASLVDRGNGMLYDNVLNVTWLQDANYAKTSGYDADGQMTWAAATTWAANLVYGGFSDWRLATNTPVDGSASYNIGNSYNGTTDVGYNITSPNSELAYMYNVNLGLKDHYSNTGIDQANFGIFGNGTIGGQANVGLVNNLQSYAYWSGAEYWTDSVNAWDFITYDGYQNYNYENNQYNQFYAWAVRPGDVSAVPVPAAFWLFGSGLMGLLGLRRRGNIG
jgi:hypothetical protein